MLVNLRLLKLLIHIVSAVMDIMKIFLHQIVKNVMTFVKLVYSLLKIAYNVPMNIQILKLMITISIFNQFLKIEYY